MNKERQDVYTRITNAIVADLEKGVRPCLNRGTLLTPTAASRGPCATTACPIRGSTSSCFGLPRSNRDSRHRFG